MEKRSDQRAELLALAERLRQFTTPELCDGVGDYRSMDPAICTRIGRPRIAGPALTVDLPSGEGSLVVDAIEQAQPGDVIVISGKGNCGCSYWGDHRSLCASVQGAAGVVIDGAFRDLEGCEQIGFPIFARALTCGTAAKSGRGALNVPVSCGGVTVRPGDLIVADCNGVLVLRPEQAEGAMERALKKRTAQEAVMERIRQSGRMERIPKLL